MYFGSVRFFKNLFLGIVIVAILVPSGLCVHFYTQSREFMSAYNQLLSGEDGASAAGDKDSPSNADDNKPKDTQGSALPVAADTENMELAYQSKYPDMYVEHSKAYTIADKTVYLTFDDGPSENTTKILDTLNTYGIKATFFVINRSDDASKAIMRRIVDEGHTIAVHSYTHDYKTIYASVDAFLDDFYQQWNYIYEVTGVKADVFRFPGGSINAYNGSLYEAIIAEMTRRGFTYYDWNVSSGDAEANTVAKDTIYNNITSQTIGKNRAMVLMHDSGIKTTTAAALPSTIETLKQNGYSFDRITNDVKPVIYPYKNYQA